MNVLDFPVPRTELPGMPELLDGKLWAQWAEQGRVFPLEDFHTAVRYVRLKPRTSCRVVVFRPGKAGQADEGPQAFLLHLHACRDRAAEAFRKVDGRRAGKEPMPFPTFLDTANAVVAVPFPLDPELPALRDFHRSHRRRGALADLLVDHAKGDWRIRKKMQLRLLAYKPGRRAVYRLAVRLQRSDGTNDTILPLHLKVEHPDTLGRSHRNLRRVHDAIPAGATWSVPAPVGMVEDRCLVASSWEPGSPFTELRAPEGRTLRATASALADLHRLDIAPAGPGPAGRPDDLRSLARDLAELLPEDEWRILALGDRLATLAGSLERSGPTVFAHGDFHPGQVLVQDGRVILVDFDRACDDHAASDVGSFVGRMIESGSERRSIDQFVQAYREVGDRQIRDADIDAAVAIALFRRASVPFRELHGRWPDRMRDRLRHVEHAAESAR